MNVVLVFLLTKTGVIRWVGNFVATWLVSQGLIEGNVEQQVAGAIVAVVTGLITKAIESVKDYETKKTQRTIDAVTPSRVEVKADGLAGPKTRSAILTAVQVAKNPNKR
jgi:hypothetical protein